MLKLFLATLLSVVWGQGPTSFRFYNTDELYMCPDYESNFFDMESFMARENRCSILEKLILSMHPLSDFEKTSLCEKSTMTMYRMYRAIVTTINLEYAMFGGHAGDTEGNAFSHCTLSGLLTGELGYRDAADFMMAKEFGKTANNAGVGPSTTPREMDAHNNESGIKAAVKLLEHNAYSPDGLVQYCLELLNANALIVLKEKYPLPIEYDEKRLQKIINRFYSW